MVVCAALLFATTGTALALADVDASPVAVGAARLVIGGGLLALAALPLSSTFRRANRLGRSRNVRLSGSAATVAIGALGVLAYQPFFFAGTRENGVAIGTVIALGTAPVATGVLGALLGQGRPSRTWWAATAIALVGIALLSGIVDPGQEAALRPLGVLASVGAGISYAVYTLAAKRLLDRGWESGGAMAALFGVAAVVAVPVLVFAGAAWLLTPRGLALALWLGVATTFVAYRLFGWGLARLPAGTVATLTLAEPLGASVLGVVVLGEHLDPVARLGVGFLVGALVLLATTGGRREPATA